MLHQHHSFIHSFIHSLIHSGRRRLLRGKLGHAAREMRLLEISRGSKLSCPAPSFVRCQLGRTFFPRHTESRAPSLAGLDTATTHTARTSLMRLCFWSCRRRTPRLAKYVRRHLAQLRSGLWSPRVCHATRTGDATLTTSIG